MTLHKIAYGREDREATFQIIEAVQNCLDLWDVSSAAYNDMKKKAEENGGTSGETGVLRFDASLMCERTSLPPF